jgi:hypothetical protein
MTGDQAGAFRRPVGASVSPPRSASIAPEALREIWDRLLGTEAPYEGFGRHHGVMATA